MSFHLPTGARSYFKPIQEGPNSQPQLGTLFDSYYLCAMLGLDQRKVDLGKDAAESAEFVKGYPSDYISAAPIIAGLLIDAEVARKGISLDERDSVENEILRLLDPQSPTSLSLQGEQLLDAYAAAGLAIAREELGQVSDLASFLLAYGNLMVSAID